MADIFFQNPENPIVPSQVIIHADEGFSVQWGAVNLSDQDVPAFVDRLVVTSIPEGCPGSDDVEHDIVFETDADQIELAAGAPGEIIEVSVPPLATGSYRLTVTLADDLGIGDETFNCIEIVDPV